MKTFSLFSVEFVNCIIVMFLSLSPIAGICAMRTGAGKTQNTGIVTLLNFGRRVPTATSALTFTHEAGHNFGSQVTAERERERERERRRREGGREGGCGRKEEREEEEGGERGRSVVGGL